MVQRRFLSTNTVCREECGCYCAQSGDAGKRVIWTSAKYACHIMQEGGDNEFLMANDVHTFPQLFYVCSG